jgi:hypothetical protein
MGTHREIASWARVAKMPSSLLDRVQFRPIWLDRV